MTGTVDRSLSDDEWRELAALLTRFASHHLDQWAAWKVATPYGDVFIDLARIPALGSTSANYRPLPPNG